MKKIFLLLSCCVIMASCTKEKNHNGSYTSLASVYQTMSTPLKTVTMNAATGGSFYGDKGVRYIFQPHSFITTTGQPVSGNVQIEVREYLHHADMIFSRVLPVSNGEPLVSGGEYYVNITQNGQMILVKDSMDFQVNIPKLGNIEPGLQFFNGIPGGQNENTSLVNWLGKAQGRPVGSLVYSGDTFSIFTDSVGYGNADKFLPNPDYKTFTVNITGITIPPGTIANGYALYDGYKTVWPLSLYQNNVFNESHVAHIPVHFVVMTVVNGNFYAGIAAATPDNGGVYTVNLTQTDPLSFKNMVDALP